MANKISYDDYVDSLSKAVAEAVAEHDKLAKRMSFNGDGSGLGAPGDELYDKVFDDYMDKLTKHYPFDSITPELLTLISTYPSEKMHDFLQQYDLGDRRQAMSPDEYYTQQEAAKILPLLQGVAKEGEDWQSLPTDELKKKGFELGYPTFLSKDAYATFVNDLAKAQTDLDRAKVLKEMHDSGWYLPNALFFPSTTRAIENAVATGEGGSKGHIAALATGDVLANSIIGGAPGMTNNIFANPIASGILSAIVQGAGEAGRQVYANKLDDQEVEVAPILGAIGAGMTRPAMIGTAQGAVSKLPTKAAMDFARGISKATRAGNPVYSERTALEALLKGYNKDIAPYWNTGNITTAKELSNASKYLFSNKVPKISKVTGVPVKGDHTIDAESVLNFYDKPIVEAIKRDGNRWVPAELTADELTRFKASNPNSAILHAGNVNEYRELFPAAFTDRARDNTASRLGLLTGELIGGIGGRVEPMIKVNPFNIGNTKPKYTDASWYKDIKKEAKKYDAERPLKPGQDDYFNAQRVKDLFDAIFKKKEDEEE